MRRLLIIFTLLGIANMVCAQRTYYYKCEKMVDGDGVASKIDIQTYFTFVNGNTAYESDANGNKTFSSFGYSTGHVLYNNTGFFIIETFPTVITCFAASIPIGKGYTPG